MTERRNLILKANRSSMKLVEWQSRHLANDPRPVRYPTETIFAICSLFITSTKKNRQYTIMYKDQRRCIFIINFPHEIDDVVFQDVYFKNGVILFCALRENYASEGTIICSDRFKYDRILFLFIISWKILLDKSKGYKQTTLLPEYELMVGDLFLGGAALLPPPPPCLYVFE